MSQSDFQSKRVYIEWIRTSKMEGLPEWYYSVPLYTNDHKNIHFENDATTVEMIKWCESNCKDTWGTYDFGSPEYGRTFFFIDEDDCLMFKMVW